MKRIKSLYLVVEFRIDNIEIFRVMEIDNYNNGDVYGTRLGYFVIEDCNRKAEIGDYPYLIDVYKDNEDEFYGEENVIKIYFITDKKLDSEDMDYVEFHATSLVEEKEDVSTLYYHRYEDKLLEQIDSHNSKIEMYNDLLMVLENHINVLEYKEESLKHLYQHI